MPPKKVIYGVAAGAIATAGVVLGIIFIQPISQLTPNIKNGACIGMLSDCGVTRRPTDASTESGGRVWVVKLAGHVSASNTLMQIFDGDFANLIASTTLTKAGRWSIDLPLGLGWHKLIFRGTHGTRVADSVHWLGLAETPPTWTNPSPWQTGNDAGTLCVDAGCFALGVVPRCAVGPYIPADGGGIIDALHAKWSDPIGCKRGCGIWEYIPDAGCAIEAGCPGRSDSGAAYKPRCCAVTPNVKGWMYLPAWTSPSFSGLDSDVTNQPTSGSTITIASNSTNANDKGKNVNIYGFDASGFAQIETISTNTTNGTIPVAGRIRWSVFAGAVLTWTPTGTITLTSTTGGQIVTTLAVGALTKGVRTYSNNRGNLINSQRISVVADAATTAKVLFLPTTSPTSSIDGVTLNGTTPVTTTAVFDRISQVVVGHLPAARSITVSAPSGWCSSSNTIFGQAYTSQSRSDILLALNFAGLRDNGCGVGHLTVTMSEAQKPWPPPPSIDAGYSHDAHIASRYRKYDYVCRPRTPGSPALPVHWNRDAGVKGAPYCVGNWCCVLNRVYQSPDGN